MSGFLYSERLRSARVSDPAETSDRGLPSPHCIAVCRNSDHGAMNSLRRNGQSVSSTWYVFVRFVIPNDLHAIASLVLVR
jgi:hypothetical protein